MHMCTVYILNITVCRDAANITDAGRTYQNVVIEYSFSAG